MLDQQAVDSFVSVKKRDGRYVEFDYGRIVSAVLRAMDASGEGGQSEAEEVADAVVSELKDRKVYTPTIEEIQDIVEEQLILLEHPKTAKRYILYRNERAQVREQKREIPQHVKDLVARSKEYFPNPLSEFVFFRTYSRWIEEENRRETWIETVQRYMDYMRERLGDKLTEEEYEECHQAILNMEVMPSMRLMWAAGPAARDTHVTCYNCSFLCINSLHKFGEVLYLLMCGTGVGYSIESHHIQQLPIVKQQDDDAPKEKWIIADSKIGWAEALNFGINTWFDGRDVEFDDSQVRGAGARLLTMGGRASGPEPLMELLRFTRAIILSRQGRRLSDLDCLDIGTKIGEIVVVGGVRRTSEITLSDLDSDDVRDAKQGHFFLTHAHRSLSNNSAVYSRKPNNTEFLEEWIALMKSGTGERGIFNRGSLPLQIPSRRLNTIGPFENVGTNPCGEILLMDAEFCNLSEIVARPNDTLKSLKKKARIAAIFGTYQATLTDFKFLTPEWKENCESERLLGASITGQWDSSSARDTENQRWIKSVIVDVNRKYAERFGISPAAATTCVKPSGTVSQLVDSSSGMHTRHSKFYIRRIRISSNDPLFRMMKDQKWPHYPEVGQDAETATTFVLEFPIKAPEGSIFKDDQTAIQQLEYWKQVKEHFTEHNPSCTISVGENEWLEVGHWVYKNWEIIGGLSFLPRDSGVYRLAPYETINEDEYNRRVKELPNVDFSQILVYESEDEGKGSQELACVGNSCEV